jgi:hypothetical protein
VTKIRNLTLCKCPAVPIKAFKSTLYLLIGEVVFRKHFHKQVEMIAHQAKPQDLGKIKRSVAFDQRQHEIFFDIAQRKIV